MTTARLACGFMPLADCAPLVVAHEVGFASSEGLDLTLHRASSWSALRDNLAAGRLAAAHMLAPVPVAASIGIGRVAGRLDALSVLSVNGNVIGVSTELAARLHGHLDDFMAADTVGRRLVSCCRRPLRVGVPFPYSMHVELLTYWLGALGMSAPADLEIQTVPPPRMAGAVGAGEIDMFIVGEPWGSIAVEAGAAELILPGAAIWQFAPEKVLAVRHDWVQAEPEIAARLLRAVWRAGRWAADPANRMTISELLARPQYLDVAADTVDRALAGRLMVNPQGEEREAPRFLEFFDGAATFPWRSQAVWIAERLAGRVGIDRGTALARARACFRPELYRAWLASAGADLPGASEKLEGALEEPRYVAAAAGQVCLGPDAFFDRRVFDPAV